MLHVAVARLVCQAAPQPPEQKQDQQEAAQAAQQEPQAGGVAPGSADAGSTSVREAVRAAESGTQKRRREADSTDWMATQLTRRFGLAGGLAWVGFLAVGVIGEQVRHTRDHIMIARMRLAGALCRALAN